MFIAMNRFRVAPGREAEFARAWQERKSYLAGVEGFLRFRLLQGDPGGTETIFISYSEWKTRPHFEAWTESEAFTRAHGGARLPEGLVLAHPQFDGYEVAEERVS